MEANTKTHGIFIDQRITDTNVEWIHLLENPVWDDEKLYICDCRVVPVE